MSDAPTTTCPFSGHDGTTINLRFFRGSRDGIITAEEIEAESRSAALQHKMGAAHVSAEAPRSANHVVDITQLVSAL
jgi:hypothetical protein